VIPEEHRAQVVNSGYNFIKTITDAYGAEAGMNLWDEIARVLDPDLKGQIFFAMITGEYNDKINVHHPDISKSNIKVSIIKSIRTWDVRGLGLKEAKDMMDSLNWQDITLEVDPRHRSRAVTELNSLGCIAR
jgi:hypothetical protein